MIGFPGSGNISGSGNKEVSVQHTRLSNKVALLAGTAAIVGTSPRIWPTGTRVRRRKASLSSSTRRIVMPR